MNFIKYFEQYGNKSFKEEPINEIDLAFFSLLSYIKYEKYLKKEKYLVDSLKKIVVKNNLKNYIYLNINKYSHFIKLFSESSRYQKLRISDYINKEDVKQKKQFAAMTIHVNFLEHYIIFRGTDSTTWGWEENFDLVNKKIIPSHLEAERYLRRMAFKYFGNLNLLGHSKGGNLAVYAGCKASMYQRRIKKIYSYDGPGFYLNTDNFNQLSKDKVINFLPENSVIGMLLNLYSNKEIVKVLPLTIINHDILNWKIKDKHFERGILTKSSKMIHEKTQLLLAEKSPSEKSKIFRMLVEMFLNQNQNNNIEEHKNLLEYITKVYKNFNQFSTQDKEILKELLIEFIGLKEISKMSIKEKINQVLQIKK